MGTPVEIIPGWEAINERLDSTLVQLNRLIHHYADVPLPENEEGNDPGKDPGCVSEECLETGIQDILKQANSRLREFTESMGFKNGLPEQRGKGSREANEELENFFALSERQNSKLQEELVRLQRDLANCNVKITQYEETIDHYHKEGVSNNKQARLLERANVDLIEKTKECTDASASNFKLEKELEECRQSHKQELGRGQNQQQRELKELKDNFQKELLAATQKHLDRELELQELYEKERESHTKTVEDMMTLHTEEVKKLKAEHAIKLEECQNHTSPETEWQDKEYELRKRISCVVQEKARYIQSLFDEHLKVQALEEKLAGVQQDFHNEKSAKNQLENELKLMKVEISLANEKVDMGLKAQEQANLLLTRVQDEMMEMRRTCATDRANLEEKAYYLQKSLSCVTNTCVQSERELYFRSKKVEELQKNMNVKQKDLTEAKSELHKAQQEVKKLQTDIKAKEEERKEIQKSYEAQFQQLQTKIFKLQMEEKHKREDILLKTTDDLECKMQRQAQQHQKYVKKLQEQFRMQDISGNSKTELPVCGRGYGLKRAACSALPPRIEPSILSCVLVHKGILNVHTQYPP